MKKTKRWRNALLAVVMTCFIMSQMTMPSVHASTCTYYPDGVHRYTNHLYMNQGYNTSWYHEYVYAQTGSNVFYASCTYSIFHGYYYLKCYCNAYAPNTCDHVYAEFHPARTGGVNNGCGMGYVEIALPTH